MPIRKTFNHSFFKTWSHNMAYVLGFFAADGCMIKHKNGGRYIEFHITDKELLEDIQKVLESNHKISERFRDKKYKVGYRLQCGSREMFDDLLNLGLTPNKSKTLTFPKIPQEFIGDFIRGYFDGDGCVSFTKITRSNNGKTIWQFTSRFTSGSKAFLQSLLTNLRLVKNIKGGFIYTKSKGGFELVFSRTDSLALFHFMYNNSHCSVYLKRKKLIFNRAVKELGYIDK